MAALTKELQGPTAPGATRGIVYGYNLCLWKLVLDVGRKATRAIEYEQTPRVCCFCRFLGIGCPHWRWRGRPSLPPEQEQWAEEVCGIPRWEARAQWQHRPTAAVHFWEATAVHERVGSGEVRPLDHTRAESTPAPSLFHSTGRPWRLFAQRHAAAEALQGELPIHFVRREKAVETPRRLPAVVAHLAGRRQIYTNHAELVEAAFAGLCGIVHVALEARATSHQAACAEAPMGPLHMLLPGRRTASVAAAAACTSNSRPERCTTSRGGGERRGAASAAHFFGRFGRRSRSSAMAQGAQASALEQLGGYRHSHTGLRCESGEGPRWSRRSLHGGEPSSCFHRSTPT
mmetsp:Transcript_8914/g.19962  ORF Transcript_8914/g.19962 Transcript_8914/m.19962 type:complete len:345 (-) Transcript_8914:54-1088(-)